MASYNNIANNDILQKIKDFIFRRERENNIKVVVLGRPATGKTALIIRCLTNQFYNNYVPSQEQTYQHTITVGQRMRKIHFDIIDTKGRNNALLSHADAAILVFSITDSESFEHIKELVKKVRTLNVNRIPIIVVANKADRCKQRTVSRDECQWLTDEYNIKVFELSAAIPTTNIDVVFEEIYYQIYNKDRTRRKRTFTNPNSAVIERRNVPLIDVKRKMSKSLDSEDFVTIVHASSLPSLI